uniref:Putative secreted protein n=1 Tax=Anopheles darlingi TaxID=43151 RepID=A0A2M4D2R0_ANODA
MYTYMCMYIYLIYLLSVSLLCLATNTFPSPVLTISTTQTQTYSNQHLVCQAPDNRDPGPRKNRKGQTTYWLLRLLHGAHSDSTN